MSTLFVGDVHACADELRQLLDEGQAERVILVGDVFNKGPDPEGTWDLVRACKAEAVLGNHDQKVLDLATAGKDRRAPDEALAWLRTLPLSLQGTTDQGRDWLAVHGGVHPYDGLAGTTRKQLLTLRRWPDDEDPDHPFWWELYAGERLVVYGHDAVRGLQDHRPETLGLDTGCVYGRRLTGYLLEEDRLLSVPARRPYRSLGKANGGSIA
jgi:predicted phosphodiesterase